jgi:hypothetical protein
LDECLGKYCKCKNVKINNKNQSQRLHIVCAHLKIPVFRTAEEIGVA